MHKNEMFLKTIEKNKKEDNLIFLNIDSITKNTSLTEHDIKKTKEFLTIKYNDSIYNSISNDNIQKMFYNIDYISIGILNEIIERYNANIIVTNAWNNQMTLEQIKSLFRIYDLERFVKDICPIINNNQGYLNSKIESINNYINKHNINNYIIFDNYDLTEYFGQNFRRTNPLLKISDVNYTNLIFNNKLNIIEDNKYIKLLSDNKEILSFRYIDYNYNNLNILYTKLEYIYCFEYGGKQYIEYLLNYLTKNKQIDYILLNTDNLIINDLEISGALDNNNIYTISKTNNDTTHQIQECKRKILSVDKC